MPAKKRKTPWRFLRRTTQVAFLAVFLWLFRRTELDIFREVPDAVNWLFRLDPLVAASAMLAGKAIVASLLLAVATIILTLILGRFFCGWVCPMGTLLDASRRLVRPPRTALRWPRAKYFLLSLILASALVGLPLVGYFDPFSILVRGMTFAVDPALHYVLTEPFVWIYRHAPESISNITEPIAETLKSSLLPAQRSTYLLAGLSFAILLGLFVLEKLGRRFWCRNLCPLGALLALVARWSFLRRSPQKACKGCRQCERECRMGAFDQDARMSPESCNLCMDCAADCPYGMVTLTFRRPTVAPAPFEPSRRLFLGAAGTGLALAAVATIERGAAAAGQPRCIRPPGAADEAAFLDACVRCGLCLKVCPTNALQPAGLDAGWSGIFSPKLVPRIGFCEFNCTLCGRVCPTGAIRRLAEDEKHSFVIGKAQFDKDRCLPYASAKPCIVCEEHCPISPDKAIQVREVEVTNAEGQKILMKQPYVKFELCIGCGICENKCPLLGAAGVRVHHLKDAAMTEEQTASPAGR